MTNIGVSRGSHAIHSYKIAGMSKARPELPVRGSRSVHFVYVIYENGPSGSKFVDVPNEWYVRLGMWRRRGEA